MAEPVLRKGSTDPAVRDLQEALKALGHNPGLIELRPFHLSGSAPIALALIKIVGSASPVRHPYLEQEILRTNSQTPGGGYVAPSAIPR